MAHWKNVGGAPSDGDGSPPHLTEVARGKRKKIATKKRKRTLTEAEVAQAVADAADQAERGGRGMVFRLASTAFTLRDDNLVQRPPRRQRSSPQSR
jgi:hypothetical protein